MVQDLRGLYGSTVTRLPPRARKLCPNPTSHRTPDLLLGTAETGEPRATPLAQWRKRMRCRGVACVSLQGGVPLHIRWVPLCESQPCLHFLGQVFRCAYGNPDPSSRDHRPRRDLARTSWPGLSPLSECVGMGCPVKWTFVLGEVLEFGQEVSWCYSLIHNFFAALGIELRIWDKCSSPSLYRQGLM